MPSVLRKMSAALSSSDCSSDSSNECRETRELLPLEKAKSKVWEYFGFPAENGEFSEKDKKKRNEVFCKLCPKSLNYLGNTTNMMVHIQYNQRLEYFKVKTKAAAAQPQMQLPQATSAVDRQTSITEAFQYLEPLSTNLKRWKMLNKSVCQCIAKDMLPISIVNNVGFP